MTLEGKVALVTGGSQGIGAAIAKKLASEGADIAILYVGNPAPAEETVAAIEAMGRKVACKVCDVSNFEEKKTGDHLRVRRCGHSGQQRRHHPG